VKDKEATVSDWKSELANLFQAELEEIKAQAAEYLLGTVLPAFEELKAELKKYGREATIQSSPGAVSITVSHEPEGNYQYTVKASTEGLGFEAVYLDPTENRIITKPLSGARRFTNLTKDGIIEGFLELYKDYLELYKDYLKDIQRLG
jgi:hypothetical protein